MDTKHTSIPSSPAPARRGRPPGATPAKTAAHRTAAWRARLKACPVKTLYRLPAPYRASSIEVYGDPENAWYEWRIVGIDGMIEYDTESQQYGCAEIALRDALVYASAD